MCDQCGRAAMMGKRTAGFVSWANGKCNKIIQFTSDPLWYFPLFSIAGQHQQKIKKKEISSFFPFYFPFDIHEYIK